MSEVVRKIRIITEVVHCQYLNYEQTNNLALFHTDRFFWRTYIFKEGNNYNKDELISLKIPWEIGQISLL